MIDAIVNLRSMGFSDLTKDSLTSSVAQLKEFLESHVEPAPEPLEKPKRSRKKGKKAKAVKKAA